MEHLKDLAAKLRPYTWYIAGGVLLLFLLLRARSAGTGGTSPSSAEPSSDPNGMIAQQQAQDLQIQGAKAAQDLQLQMLDKEAALQERSIAAQAAAQKNQAILGLALLPYQMQIQTAQQAGNQLAQVQASIGQLLSDGRPTVHGRNFLTGKRAGAAEAAAYDKQLTTLRAEEARLTALTSSSAFDPSKFLSFAASL